MGRQLSLSVVGADYLNSDASKSNRRFEIALCAPGDVVKIVSEPSNPADRNAVAVFSERGMQLGYLTAERAPFINKLMQEDEPQAIFQERAAYGAIIRVGFGEQPVLPSPRTQTHHEPEVIADTSGDFYPDYIPPDD